MDSEDTLKGKKKSEMNLRDKIFKPHFSMWVTSDLLSSVKRLKLLQSEERVFISLSGLRDVTVCRAVVEHFYFERAEQLISDATSTNTNTTNISAKNMTNNSSRNSVRMDGANDVVCRESGVTALTPEIRRLCALLAMSPIRFAHGLMKQLISKGATGLAMDVAKSLESEDFSASTSSGSPSTIDGTSGDGHLKGDDLTTLLGTALTLCSMAAKQMQGQGQGGGSRIGDKDASTSMESITRPFIVSRDLLRGVTSICSPEHLGRILDVLNGSELVLAVYERVEGALTQDPGIKNSTPKEFSPEGEFRVSDSSFTRDGILMAPGAVLGHVLRYSAAELRRRMTATATNNAKKVWS